MKNSQISVGNYTYMYYSFDYFLASMERLGINTIELWGATPHFYSDDASFFETCALQKKLAQRGFTVSCVTPEQVMYPINIGAVNRDERARSIDFFRRHIDIANILQTPRMLVTSGRCNLDDDKSDCFKYCVDSLQELGYYAGRRGVTIAFETLTREGYDLVVRAAESKAVLDAVNDYDHVKAMIDVDESARFGESPTVFFALFGKERMEHCHFVDGMPGGHLAMGDGVLPMRRYLEELDAAGYEGYISLEVMNDRYYYDPEPAIRQSVEFLRDYAQAK